jgi:HK97 family phage major capsid protein
MAEQKTPLEMIEEINKNYKALKDEMEKKNANPETIEKLQTRLDDLEVKMQRPDTTPNVIEGKQLSKEEIEYKTAFDTYARKGIVDEHLEKKQMATDSNPDGGYMVPSVMANKIVERVRQMSPIRQIANIVTISSAGEYKIPRENTDDFDSGWIGERAERTVTDNGTLQMVKIPLHEQYAQPALTRKLMIDSNFDWEAYINRKVANKFARQEATAFVTGDGVNKPLGFLSNPTTQGIGVVNEAFSFDGLMDLQASLLEEYLPNATWLLNRLTLRDIRKLKDNQGRYLWEPSTQVGKPNTILGYNYNLATDMPTPGTNALSIAFGDFAQAYTIVDGAGMYTLRDELTKKPNILFYTTREIGGGIEMPDALKIFKQA